jgi:hypothetical protein
MENSLVKKCALFLIILSLAWSCVTTDQTGNAGGETERVYEDPELNPWVFWERGQESEELGRFVESIKFYLRTLYLLEKTESLTGMEATLLATIQEKLISLETEIVLIHGDDWISDGQVKSSIGDSSDPGFIQPSLFVYRTGFGGGRLTVPDAPVSFSIIKGEGSLERKSLSNDFGATNTVITDLSTREGETLVRAQIVFTVEEKEYPFSSSKIDFIYLPPIQTIYYVSLENRSGEWQDLDSSLIGLSQWVSNFGGSPELLVGEYSTLELSRISGSTFARIRENNPGVYLLKAVFFSEEPVQFGERNIFIQQGRVEAQVFRIGSGELVYSLSSDRLKAQSGSPSRVQEDLQRLLSAELSELTSNMADEIQSTLWED